MRLASCDSADTPLMDAGVDSVGAEEFVQRLREAFNVEVPATLIFEYGTPREIASHLESCGRRTSETETKSQGRVADASHCRSSIETMRCRWPSDPETCHVVCRASGDAVGDVPSKRWIFESELGSAPLTDYQRSCVRHGGYIASADAFDCAHFRISASEVRTMDPQQRVLLELGYDALHASNLRLSRLSGRAVGHFLGIVRTDWFRMRAVGQGYAVASAYNVTSDTCSVAAGRLSYQLGVHGPCLSIDTACSSSLSAAHVAMSVAYVEEDVAVLSGIRLELSPQHTLDAAGAAMLSPRGRCYTLDRRADGYVSSEAASAAVLRLERGVGGPSSATATSMAMHAAVNQDGRSASLTAPNGSAQRSMISALHGHVVKAASSEGGAPTASNAAEAVCLELHGTGTALGDPTETSAALGSLGCARLGGAKANAGHTMAASGCIGICKLLEDGKQGVSSGNAHLRTLNPLVSSVGASSDARGVAAMDTQSTPSTGRGGVGAVSSFGYSGTIAHVAFVDWKARATTTRFGSRLRYRRIPFAWLPAATAGVSRVAGMMSFYGVAWSRDVEYDAGALAECLLVVCGPRSDYHLPVGRTLPTRPEDDGEYDAALRSSYGRVGIMLMDERDMAPSARLHSVVSDLVRAGVDRLTILCRGIFRVRSDEANVLTHSSASGIVFALRREHPSSRASLVDALRCGGASLKDAAPEGDREWILCRRGCDVFAPRLAEGSCRSPPSMAGGGAASRLGNSPDAPCCVSVVTGGLGGLGLRACRVLLHNGGTVLLTSRSGAVPRKGQGLGDELRRCGRDGAVHACCDVGDASESLVALAWSKRRGVRTTVSQIVHAAGITHARDLLDVRAGEARGVYASKASAALAIDRCCSSSALRTFLSLSSISSFWCRPGQSCYGAANAYLDRHAERRRARGNVGTAFALPGVEGVGMGAALDVRRSFTLSLPQYDAMLGLMSRFPSLGSQATVLPTLLLSADGSADAANPLFASLVGGQGGGEWSRGGARGGKYAIRHVCLRRPGDVHGLRREVASNDPLVVEWCVAEPCNPNLVVAATKLALRSAPFILVCLRRLPSIPHPGPDPVLSVLRAYATIDVRVRGTEGSANAIAVSGEAVPPAGRVRCFETSESAHSHARMVAKRWASIPYALLSACHQRLPARTVEASFVAMGSLYPAEARVSPVRLVRLHLDRRRGVAMLLLDDPQRSNTISHDLADDVHQAVRRLRHELDVVRCVVLAGEGKHFSVGVNPFNYSSSVRSAKPLAASAHSCEKLLAGFVAMRRLGVPVVAVVHGKLIGAALASALNADVIISERDATFQHGNIVRGVCPLGMLSRNLVRRVGGEKALEMYLTNDVWSAETALAFGLVQEVVETETAARRRGVELAVELASLPGECETMLARRDPEDATLMALEAVGHARCLDENGGRYAQSDVATFDQFKAAARSSSTDLKAASLSPPEVVICAGVTAEGRGRSMAGGCDTRGIIDRTVPPLLDDAAMDDILKWPTAKGCVLHIRGRSREQFCLGGNPSEDRLASGDFLRDVERFASIYHLMRRVRSVVFCRGAVRGFGMIFPCAGTRVVAHPDATFGFPEVRRGVLPGVVSVAARARLGDATCRAVFCAADTFDAREALRIGLVDEISDDVCEDDLDMVANAHPCLGAVPEEDVGRATPLSVVMRFDERRVVAVIERECNDDDAMCQCARALPDTVRVVVLHGFSHSQENEECVYSAWMPLLQSRAFVIAASPITPPPRSAHYRICDVTCDVDGVHRVAANPLDEALLLAQWVASHPRRGVVEMMSLISYTCSCSTA